MPIKDTLLPTQNAIVHHSIMIRKLDFYVKEINRVSALIKVLFLVFCTSFRYREDPFS